MPALHPQLAALLERAAKSPLPPYDEALLGRELSLFPDWYVARHLGRSLAPAQAQTNLSNAITTATP